MGAWVIFIATLLATARSEKLTAGNLIPTVGLHAALFVLAFWLAAGLGHGRRVGGATALVGFFTLAGIAPAAIIASGGIQHDAPVLLIAVLVTFWAITVRTLVALIGMLNRRHEKPPSGDALPGGSALGD